LKAASLSAFAKQLPRLATADFTKNISADNPPKLKAKTLQRRRVRGWFSVLILSFLFMLVPFLALSLAASISVKASTDRQEYAQDEPINFSIEITGNYNASPEIELPDFRKDFDVISTAQSFNLNIQGKEESRQTTFIYVLAAKAQGKFTVPEAQVKIGKDVFKTQPIDIEVTPPKNPLPSEPPEEAPEDSDQQQFVI
jgi:hypothetical protein